MPFALFEDERGDLRNAKAFAAASHFAYYPAEGVPRRSRTNSG